MDYVSESLHATEAECAKGRTAPRVSLEDIDAAIRSVAFVNGADMLYLSGDDFCGDDSDACCVLTVCLVVMRNGFTVLGKSAPASPENFDAELGRKLAYEDAVRQIWPLMGFALKERIANEPSSYVQGEDDAYETYAGNTPLKLADPKA
jgi:hypothetical protein